LEESPSNVRNLVEEIPEEHKEYVILISVNLKYGYPLLEIRSPREVLYEK